jgi:hypothetical protein
MIDTETDNKEIIDADNDWEQVKDYDNYEINKNPPHFLRNKKITIKGKDMDILENFDWGT